MGAFNNNNGKVAVDVEFKRLNDLLNEKARRQQVSQERLAKLQADIDRHNESVRLEIDRTTARNDADIQRLDAQIVTAKSVYNEAQKLVAEADASLDEIEVTPSSAIILKLRLPGSGLNIQATRKIKPVLTLTSIVVSGFSLGLVTRILTPKHLFDRIDGVVLSLIFGVAVSLGLWLLSAQGWGLYGSRVGGQSDAIKTLRPLVLLTAVLVTIFAVLDGHAIYVLNATRASFSPELQVDRMTSLLIGACLSGLYIGGLCFAGYIDGYNATIAETVQAEQDLERQASRNDPVFLGRAYEARKCKKMQDVARANLKELEDSRLKIIESFESRRDELKKALKDRPDHLPDDIEDRRLDALIEKQKLRVHAETMRSGGSHS